MGTEQCLCSLLLPFMSIFSIENADFSSWYPNRCSVSLSTHNNTNTLLHILMSCAMCKYAQIATAAIKSTFLTGKTCPHFASVSEKINMFQNDTFLWFWVGEQIEKYGGATCRLQLRLPLMVFIHTMKLFKRNNLVS